ncbi:MAG: TIGR02530 family flagellar biosynthesis protein [Dehalococcoidia bacterium]
MAIVPGIGVGGIQPSELQGSAATPRRQPDASFDVQFSKHAAKRLEQRGMDMDASRMERLERAVGQAAEKGSKDSLILLDELALVVSVQNRTVVTAVDEASRREHVFTNIDSVVIAQ